MNTAARIAPIEPPFTPEVQADFDKVMRGAPPLLLFRTVARNPRVLSRMMAGGLLDKGSISLRQRELMILRITALCGAEYEWGVHVAAFGGKAKWTPTQIHSTRLGNADDSCWSADEKLVLRMADSIYSTKTVDDAMWSALAQTFRDEQLVELIMLAGLYHAVSFM